MVLALLGAAAPAAAQPTPTAGEPPAAPSPPPPVQVMIVGLRSPAPYGVDRVLERALQSVDQLTTWYATTRTNPELSLVRVEGEDAEAATASLVDAIGDLVETRQGISEALRARLDGQTDKRVLEVERAALEEQRRGLAVQRGRVIDRRTALEGGLDRVEGALRDVAIGLYVSDQPETTGVVEDIAMYNDRRELEVRVDATVDELIDQRHVLLGEIERAEAEIRAVDQAADAVLDEARRVQLDVNRLVTEISALGRRAGDLDAHRADLDTSLPTLIARAQRTRLVASVRPIGIPLVSLDAYLNAALAIRDVAPACRIRWQLLAGIAAIESAHGRHGDATIEPSGQITGNLIFGPVLDGSLAGTTVIDDTDDGVMDGNTDYDRAVGPFQFIPETWEEYALDANGDGRADPHNLYDAALTAAGYLCASATMATDQGIATSVLSYNHSEQYLADVTSAAARYIRTFSPPSASFDPAALVVDETHRDTIETVLGLMAM